MTNIDYKEGKRPIGFYLMALIFSAVNALFVAKYSSRVTPLWPYLTMAYLSVASLSVVWFRRIETIFKGKRMPAILSILLFVAMFVGLQYSIDPMTVQVDRWSAIHNFLNYLLSGRYPYLAQTHLGGYGSPFPFWQIFHLPFYLLGNVGLSLLFCILLFLYVVASYWSVSKSMLCLLLMFISPAFWYEVAVRSDLMANFFLLAVWCCWLQQQVNLERRWLFVSIVCGLLLSTRLNTLVPMSIVLLRPFIMMDWSKRVGAVVVLLLIFALTFLPFYLWAGNKFFTFEFSPFVLQSRYGNPIDFLFFIPFVIWLSWRWKGAGQMARNIAVMLCTLTFVTFLHNMILWDNFELFSSTYDITYFSTALPFACLSLVLL